MNNRVDAAIQSSEHTAENRADISYTGKNWKLKFQMPDQVLEAFTLPLISYVSNQV